MCTGDKPLHGLVIYHLSWWHLRTFPYKRSFPTDVQNYNSREGNTTFAVSCLSFEVEKVRHGRAVYTVNGHVRTGQCKGREKCETLEAIAGSRMYEKKPEGIAFIGAWTVQRKYVGRCVWLVWSKKISGKGCKSYWRCQLNASRLSE